MEPYQIDAMWKEVEKLSDRALETCGDTSALQSVLTPKELLARELMRAREQVAAHVGEIRSLQKKIDRLRENIAEYDRAIAALNKETD